MTIRISEKLETDGNSVKSYAIIRNYWELPGHLVERAGGLTSLALQAGELAGWLATRDTLNLWNSWNARIVLNFQNFS